MIALYQPPDHGHSEEKHDHSVIFPLHGNNMNMDYPSLFHSQQHHDNNINPNSEYHRYVLNTLISSTPAHVTHVFNYSLVSSDSVPDSIHLLLILRSSRVYVSRTFARIYRISL